MSKNRNAWIYVLASRKNGTLYVGVTTELRVRVWQRKTGAVDGFTKKHHTTTLVHHGEFHGIWDAIAREKELKGWTRRRKIALIEAANADWADLAAGWFRVEGLDPSPGSG